MFYKVVTLHLIVFCPVALAATGDVIASFDSSFPSPDGLMWDGKNLWATDCATSRIDRVDPADGKVTGSIDVTGVNSDELAWDGEAMWVSDHTAVEMPGMGAPPSRLYRVNPSTAQVEKFFEAPSQNKYPMGMAWDGTALWNVDPWDGKIYQLDKQTGAIIRSIPSPASGACGLTWDGACLWLTSASTNERVYHIDPSNGQVIRSFPGPGGAGHQSTGVAWDGKNLWVHDEATGRAKIYKLQVDDITEGGRCAGAYRADQDAGITVPDAGASPDAVDAGSSPGDGTQDAGAQGPSDPQPTAKVGCSATGPQSVAMSLTWLGALSLLATRLRRRR